MKCDVCDREFAKNYFAHIERATHHACSEKCQAEAQKKGGKLDAKKRQVMQRRYGVDNPQQLGWVKDKSRQTNIERYGTEIGSQSDVVKERARQTNRERFGVDWHTQSENFANKAQATWHDKYGVLHPMQAPEVKAKYDFRAIWQKAHQTKKSNGTYANSAAEDRFFERLNHLFASVERQAPVHHESGTWLIDFKIGEIYVQFDGVYWHGLDRPIEKIRSAQGIRNATIVDHYDRDRLQDAWFASQRLRLVRITDTQAKKLSDVELLQLLTTDSA